MIALETLRRAALVAALTATVAGDGRALQTPAPAPAAGLRADAVRPGDQIRLKIWREPEMSGDIRVDEAGTAILPMLGPIPVDGLRPDSLQQLLVSRYSEYLKDPAIDIAVLRRVTIVGAVRTPGVYHVDPTMTLNDALALAGGAAPDGKKNQVELRRQGEQVVARLTERGRLADTPLRSGDELFVPERSWVSRNFGLVLAGISTAASLVFLIAR